MKNQSLGFDENITAMLSYLLGWVSGLVIILTEKENNFVRFHAMQSIVVFGSLTLLSIVASIIPFFYAFLISIINLFAAVLWIILMVKAYQHEKFELPVAAEITSNLLDK